MQNYSYPCCAVSKAPEPTPELVGDYERYLTEVRGVTSPQMQLATVRCFLSFLEEQSIPMERIGKGTFDRFLLEQGRYYQKRTVASLSSFLRGFLRYLAVVGIVVDDMSPLVEHPRIVRGERDPRYLRSHQVAATLKTMNLGTIVGLRDRAILTLLAVYLDEDAFQKLVDGYIADNVHRIRTLESRRKHPRLIFAFRRWLLARDGPALDVDTVTEWMTERTRTAEIRTVQANAIMIAGFCRYLVEIDRMGVNPFRMLRDRHRFDGYLGIARMLKESGDSEVLKERADIVFSGPLAPSFSEYLEYIEGLGRNSTTPRRKLASFERHLRHEGIVELQQITTADIERWQASFPAP